MRRYSSRCTSGAAGAAFSLLVVAQGAAAYEYESAVPLTITAALGSVSVERIAISISGHDVMLETALRNETATRAPVAFYASTPLAGQSGVAEEYADKRFSDLRVTVNDRPWRINTLKRAFFMGRDITAMLKKAGLGVMPDLDADWKKVSRLPKVLGVKPERWEGMAIHTWTDSMPAGAAALHRIRYRSMPQFWLDEPGSARFDTAVRQHCGDPAAVRGRLREAHGAVEQVVLERHEVPVDFMSMRDVEISIHQPPRSAQGRAAVTTLVCGVPNPANAAHLAGTLAANQSLSVLVVLVPMLAP